MLRRPHGEAVAPVVATNRVQSAELYTPMTSTEHPLNGTRASDKLVKFETTRV